MMVGGIWGLSYKEELLEYVLESWLWRFRSGLGLLNQGKEKFKEEEGVVEGIEVDFDVRG